MPIKALFSFILNQQVPYVRYYDVYRQGTYHIEITIFQDSKKFLQKEKILLGNFSVYKFTISRAFLRSLKRANCHTVLSLRTFSFCYDKIEKYLRYRIPQLERKNCRRETVSFSCSLTVIYFSFERHQRADSYVTLYV